MKKLASLVLLAVGALAQTLVEVTAVAALASSLDPAVRLPQGTYRARGLEPILARFPEAKGYTLEAFAAKGLTSRLHAAFVQQVLTNWPPPATSWRARRRRWWAGRSGPSTC